MRNPRYQLVIRTIFIICCVSLAAVSATSLWYWNIGVGWTKGYFGHQTLVMVSLLFCLIYILFGRTYHAFAIGKYRLTDLAFSHKLSFGFSDIVLFVASVFWFHNLKRLKILYFIIAFLFQACLSVLLVFIFNRWNARFDGARKITIVYGNEGYRELIKKMRRYNNRYELVAAVQENGKEIESAIKLAEDVYLFEVNRERRSQLIRCCRELNKQVHVSLDVDDILLQGFTISHFFDTPFFNSGMSEVTWYYPYVKRSFDVLFSILAMVIFSPAMIITGIMIKMEDRGSVIYKQNRLTKDGRVFTMYKFRSMKENSEERPILAEKSDARITRVGRVIRFCRIDELPQIINVIKGDMSLVGPRPERPELAKKYEKEFHDFPMRLSVRAGLTGYAQVYGKYNTIPEDKLKMDLLYITHRSVLMDLKILFYTVKILFKAESTEGV